MASKLDLMLNNLNILAVGVSRATKRRRKWRREHLVTACQIGSAVLSVVSTFVPAVRPLAATLNGLQTTIPLEPEITPTPSHESRLAARLQLVHQQLKQTPCEDQVAKMKLEGQQELLLDLFEDHERLK